MAVEQQKNERKLLEFLPKNEGLEKKVDFLTSFSPIGTPLTFSLDIEDAIFARIPEEALVDPNIKVGAKLNSAIARRAANHERILDENTVANLLTMASEFCKNLLNPKKRLKCTKIDQNLRLFNTSDSDPDSEWEDVNPTSLSTLKRIPNLQDLRDINSTKNKSKKSSQTPRSSKKFPVQQTPAKGKPSISTMTTTYVKLKDAIATIPKFDRATMSLEDFLDSVEYAKEIIDGAEEALLVKLVRTKIGEEARKGLKDIDIKTVAELKKQLRGLYSSGLTVSALQGLLAQQIQQPGESVLSFATKIRDLGNQILQTKKLTLATGAAIPKDFEENVKGSQEECFRKGLLNNISVRMKSIGGLTDIIKEAITIEKDLEVKSMMRRKLEKRCGNCGRTNHATEQCRVKRVNTVVTTTTNTHSNAHGNGSKKFCTYCKKPGHLVDKCFKYVYDQVQKAKGSSKPSADSNAQSPCGKYDIVLYANSIEEHEQKFNQLAERLRKANLKLQPTKIAKDDAHLVHNRLNNIELRMKRERHDISEALKVLNETAKDLYYLGRDWYRWSYVTDLNYVLKRVLGNIPVL
ncbi:unnamed protein product [Trichogramma brassicae]|uniref:CCHC-type domain-containing protein n=1 Tax=Trichogramma brassicae TaxID=86971 RepID=A0A6H5IES7_9HYME|nr:unnamed protein product [Trichogramma brassicae]